jgi:hypothetical protein
MALFIRLIIVFSAETVFFSHNKSANNIFSAGLAAQPNGANATVHGISCTVHGRDAGNTVHT